MVRRENKEALALRDLGLKSEYNLDEIYTPNLNQFKKLGRSEMFSHSNHWHFGISGVIVGASSLNDINLRARRIKQRYYPGRPNLIFHYSDIINKRFDYSDLAITGQKYQAFTNSIDGFIRSSTFKLTAVLIDKHELIKRYGVFDPEDKVIKIKKIGSNMFPKSKFINYNLYLLCLKHLIISFYRFITTKKILGRGIIVAEARGEREDSDLREAFQKIYYNGISNITPKELRAMILDLMVVPKKQNYIGTQLADLVLYPTFDRYASYHHSRPDHFIKFETSISKKIIPNGIKILP